MENLSRRTFLACTLGAVLAPRRLSTPADTAEVPTLLDHILLGCNDVERGIAFVEERTGVRAAFGGVHPGRGTQNALLSLGTRRYLEVIAPDPQQASVEQYSVITKLNEPRLIGWAAHRDDLDPFAARLRGEGIEFEGPQPGSRQRPDGKVLRWRALRLKDDHGGLLPFFIEWSKDSVHPSKDAPEGGSLARFGGCSTEAEELTRVIKLLDLDLNVRNAKAPRLDALFSGAKGSWSISS
jgi:hypothetical protein